MVVFPGFYYAYLHFNAVFNFYVSIYKAYIVFIGYMTGFQFF